MLFKIHFFKSVFTVSGLLLIMVGVFNGRIETSILAERHYAPINEYKNALEIKGRIHFVSDDELFYYQNGKDIYIAGWFVMVMLGGWLGLRETKPPPWAKKIKWVGDRKE